MICYVNYCKDSKKVYFKTSDNKLFKEYNKIWEKSSCLIISANSITYFN